MNRTLLLLGASLLLPFAAGCAAETSSEPAPKPLPRPSTDFATKDIYPSTSAQDDGTNLAIYAALLGDGRFLTLGATDRLTAKVGDGAELVLAAQGQTYDPHWSTIVPSPKDAVDVVVTLDRAGDANDARVKLHVPPPFAFDGATPSDVAFDAKFDVAISPPAVKDETTVYWAIVEGACVEANTTSDAVIDAGKLTFTVPKKALKSGTTSCDATVKVQHVQPGKVEGALQPPFPTDAIGLRERRFQVKLHP